MMVFQLPSGRRSHRLTFDQFQRRCSRCQATNLRHVKYRRKENRRRPARAEVVRPTTQRRVDLENYCCQRPGDRRGINRRMVCLIDRNALSAMKVMQYHLPPPRRCLHWRWKPRKSIPAQGA